MQLATIDKYIKNTKNEIDRYGYMSYRSMVIYYCIRIGVIVLAAALPFIVAQELQLWAGIVGFLIAAATGVEGFFRPGEKWQLFRTTQLALLREMHLYELSILNIPQEQQRLENDKFRAAYDRFYKTTGEIMSGEADKFWKFAVTRDDED